MRGTTGRMDSRQKDGDRGMYQVILSADGEYVHVGLLYSNSLHVSDYEERCQ